MIVNSNIERMRFAIFCIIFAGLWRRAATLCGPLLSAVPSRTLTMVDSSIQPGFWRKHPIPNDQHRLQDIFLGDEKTGSIMEDALNGFREAVPEKELAKLFKSVERQDRGLEIDK